MEHLLDEKGTAADSRVRPASADPAALSRVTPVVSTSGRSGSYDRAVTFDSWLLALHLLSAAALVGAVTVFWVVILAVRNASQPSHVLALRPLMRVGGVVVIIGSLGTIVFGLWLAITLDAYHPWDGWVIAAIVLWAIGSETGRRSDPEYAKAFAKAKELEAAGETGANAELRALCRPRRGMLLHATASLAIFLVLVDMIWKPGT